ncbi:MAG: hypothetical protein ABSE79_16520 [Terriglobia bacterium]|jgi:hypothetical protein
MTVTQVRTALSGCLRQSLVSAIPAVLEHGFDLVMIAQERDEQVGRPVLKVEAQRSIATALENLVAQFTNPQAAVQMRAAKGLG